MRLAKVAMLGMTLTALMVPLVYAAWFIGPTNYRAAAPLNGNVTFAQNFQASASRPYLGLFYFTNFNWLDNLRGNIGFAAVAGVNMTVTAVGKDTIQYTVTTAAPGPVNTYLYYRRNVPMNPMSPPTAVTGGTFTHAGSVTTVTTTGSPVLVTVTYGASVAPLIFNASAVLIGLMPFLVLAAVIGDAHSGDLGPGTLTKVVLIVIVLSAFAWIISGWGY